MTAEEATRIVVRAHRARRPEWEAMYRALWVAPSMQAQVRAGEVVMNAEALTARRHVMLAMRDPAFRRSIAPRGRVR